MSLISVEAYKPEWATIFLELKSEYSKVLADCSVDIQHVGSTSVEGLAAKPIIDIDVIVEPDEDIEKVIKALETLGYKHIGDLGIKGREVMKNYTSDIPFTSEKKTWLDHHLYVSKRGCLSLQNHLILRDHLRHHPEDVKGYSDLKKELAIRFKDDINSYVEAKTDFILNILEKYSVGQENLSSIREANKK